MSLAEPLELERLANAELGRRLIDLSSRLAAMECEWLSALAEFDTRYGWWEDGEVSCVDWLVSRCGLSRVTAREKLRVAHELQRRPLVNVAFAKGSLSYTKVRAMTRVTGANEDTDRWLLKLAEAGTAQDLEIAVRHFLEIQDQNKPVDNYLRRWDHATVRSSRTYDGMMVIETVVPIEEGAEALALLRAAEARGPVDSAESTGKRRVRALLDLLRAGHANLDTPPVPPLSHLRPRAPLHHLRRTERKPHVPPAGRRD
ncbi:MAG: endonuclease, partial [Acidimicrobiales bacterium]|nr:endonuclease [Acidimicrobiales bacterium]